MSGDDRISVNTVGHDVTLEALEPQASIEYLVDHKPCHVFFNLKSISSILICLIPGIS
jgi:hypothetical protein